MKKMLKDIIDDIDQKFKCLQINFEDDSWRKDIPSEAGWYLIKTNTPFSVLQSTQEPQYKAHTNIPQTVNRTLQLQDLCIAIIQSDNEDYVVYNGEAGNLKARAREHKCGHPKTYCLGLSNYKTLHRYKWIFCYVAVSSCKASHNTGKLLRLAVEQGWRTIHGWPILCRK